MITIKDFKGRIYNVMEVRRDNTLLECVIDKSRVVIRNFNWDGIGFVRP